MKKLFIKLFLISLFCLIFNISYANNFGSVTGFELPRFVSLKSNDSNIRVGPSKNYPIILKYTYGNLPLKVTEEYGEWRKIIDYKNNIGWIHESLIKGDRYAITISKNIENIYLYNIPEGKEVGEINTGLVVNLRKCKIDWCLIEKKGQKGWVKKSNVWGIKKEEEFNLRFFQPITDYYFKSINFFEEYFYE